MVARAGCRYRTKCTKGNRIGIVMMHSETGSRIFAGCRLLTSRRVDDWVSTYHSWEQPRCPHEGLQLKGSGIHAPARPLTPRRLVQGQSNLSPRSPEPVSEGSPSTLLTTLLN